MLDSAQAWSAKSSTVDQWMQIDMGAQRTIVGVVTQGRTGWNQRVTGYSVSTSTDGGSWLAVNNGQQFGGNTDGSTKVLHEFASVSARYVRFYVKTWNEHITMRAAVVTGTATILAITVYSDSVTLWP